MEKEERIGKDKGIEKKQPYVKPRVLATYKKKELEEMIMPHVEGGGCGYGCEGMTQIDPPTG